MWTAMLWVAVEVSLMAYVGPGDDRFDPEKGMLVDSLRTSDGALIDYERPVVLLPAQMKVGETYQSQRRFVLRVDGVKKDVGSHYFEAKLLAVEAIDGYDDCLKIRRHAVRMNFSGTEQGEDVTEWYAKGVGLVKATGERYWKDADGNRTRTEPIAWSP